MRRLPCCAALLLAATPCQALEPGQRVLARWKLGEDRYHYPARVLAVRGRMVRLRYLDDAVGWMPAAAVVGRTVTRADRVDGEGLRLRVLLRTDHGLRTARPPVFAPGAQVLAKWDTRAWYAGRVTRRVGEAVRVRFLDGNAAWIPINLVAPLVMRPGSWVLGPDPRSGQPFLGRLAGLSGSAARVRFFDGARRTVSLARLSVWRDQPAVEHEDPCRAAGQADRREAARQLRGWLSRRLHFYDSKSNAAPVAVSAERLEIVLALWLPVDRRPRQDWQRLLGAWAAQAEAFLRRELGRWTAVQVRVHPRPVVGGQPLAWYRANLDERSTWRDWAPSGDCLRAVFPDGAKAGRHRVLVVLPDAPGVSADDSGVEQGLGFVRLRGEYVGAANSAVAVAVGEAKPRTTFDRWRPAYLATTIAHEALHTIGLPHTDGDPWSVMNLGCWYAITQPEVHLAALHKIVLRSPFRDSLSLSQGLARYLLDPGARYLRLIARTGRLDPDLRLRYAHGVGLFRLRPTLAAFGPGTDCRQGVREATGERSICRAYLAALIAYLVERLGVEKLRELWDASDATAPDVAARLCGTSVDQLEADWHAWLNKRIK